MIQPPWEASDVTALGVAVAGLSPEEFSSLYDVTLGDVSPVTLRHLTQDHLSHLTDEQLKLIPDELVSEIRRREIDFENENEVDTDEVKVLGPSLVNKSQEKVQIAAAL